MRDLNRLKKSLKDKKQNIFSFETEDRFFFKTSLSLIQESLGDDLEVEEFDCRDSGSDLDRALLSLKTPPFLSSEKLIIFKNFNSFKKTDVFLEALQIRAAQTYVILLSEKWDKRKKVVKEILKTSEVFSFSAIKNYEKAGWVGWLGTRHGFKISDELAGWWACFLPDNLESLDSEMTKIKNFLGEDFKKSYILKKEDIESVIFQHHNSQAMFELGHLLASQKVYEFLSSSRKCFERGDNPVTLLIFLARHFRLLLKLKKGLKKRKNLQELSQDLSVPSFFLDKYKKEASSWTEKSLENLLVYLHRMDRQLKTTGYSKELVFESLALKFLKLS